MRLNIPFYENNENGNQCLQVTMKCVIKHFLNKELSLTDLDKLTGRKDDLWTYTGQSVSVLHDLGLNLKYYSKEDLEPYLEGEPFIRKHFGKDAEKILKHTDVPTLVNAIKKLLNYNIFEKKKLTISDIEKEIENGHVPIVLLDHNKMVCKNDFYQGHFVVLTGFDEENIYYHESGPTGATPNKKVNKKTFEKAINANGTDNDCVIVYGKRD